MRVPINPQTRVPQGQLGYERNVDISSGTRALGEVVAKYGESLQAEDRKRELFDVQKMLVDETNNIQLDFEERKQRQALGAPNFTQQVHGIYNTRHEEMVAKLKEDGYSDDTINEFASRLGNIRAQYIAKAIDFQEKSRFAKVVGDTEQLAISLSQYAGSNPNAVGSALNELRVALDNSGLDEIEKERLYEARKSVILQGAREGFALQHPEIVVGLYAPNELVTTSPTNLPHGQEFDLKAYLTKMNVAEGTGKNPRSSAIGFGQFLDGTWLETYKKVFGETGESRQQILAKKTNKAIALKLSEKFTGDNIQGLVNANAPVNDATVYLAHFLGLSGALKVITAHADETISKLVSNDAIKSNPGVFKKMKTAADLMGWAREKMGVETEQLAAAAPTANRDELIRQARELGMEQETAEAYADAFAPEARTTVQPLASIDSTGRTGIAILDLSSAPERMQMLTQARTILNGREADAKAIQQKQHDDWLNSFYNQLQDGKLGQADLDKAYADGLIKDYDERKKAQGILDSKAKKETALQTFGLMLRSGGKFNPYDDKAQEAVDAGFAKAVEIAQRAAAKGDESKASDPWNLMARTWQRTGILPSQGGVMLRGALIGTDPTSVAAAASVASNMLKENPNAFAGVEGGEEIGKAAANYAHYVDDLGMTAQDAAAKIATQNSPEFQAKVHANRPARDAFEKLIVGDSKQAGIDVEKVINDSVFGKAGFGSGIRDLFSGNVRGKFGPAQRAEAKQTYVELAMDHYDKYNDPEAAQSYAARQLGRFYGVESGRLLKYPATKAYPEIQGSRDYIFDQAKSFVDKVAGVDVPKEDIFLQPTPTGTTAAAFRAGKAPPYQIIYITRENDQPVYHQIPGKVFVADVEQAKRDAAMKARQTEKNVREASQAGAAAFGGGY